MIAQYDIVATIAVLGTSIIQRYADKGRLSEKPTKVELLVFLPMNFGAFICHRLTIAFF